MKSRFKSGFGQIIITPKNIRKSSYLAGLGARNDSDDVILLDDLYVKVSWFKKNDKDIIIINGDLLYFSDELCLDIWEWIENEYRVERINVVLNATHTHCAYHPGGAFFDGSLQDNNFIRMLSAKIKSAIEDAFNNLKEAKLYIAKTKCDIGVNRRKLIVKAQKRIPLRTIIANRPNPDAEIDHDLYAIKVIRGEQVDAYLLNYACHPSVLRGAYISSDFPGRIGSSLKKIVDRSIFVSYLQGFSGNIRPNLLSPASSFLKSPKKFIIEFIEGSHFEKNTSEKHIDRIGQKIADKIKTISDDNFKEVHFKPKAKEVEVELSFEKAFSKEYFLSLSPKTRPEKQWLEHVIKNYICQKKILIKIRRIDLDETYSFLCIPGEVFCEYSLKFKEIFAPREIIPLGYANGMVGYLPTGKAVREGGYEVERAYRKYGLPCPFSEDIEKTIINGVKELYAS